MGSASSHNVSACAATTRNIPCPTRHKHAHMQAYPDDQTGQIGLITSRSRPAIRSAFPREVTNQLEAIAVKAAGEAVVAAAALEDVVAVASVDAIVSGASVQGRRRRRARRACRCRPRLRGDRCERSPRCCRCRRGRVRRSGACEPWHARRRRCCRTVGARSECGRRDDAHRWAELKVAALRVDTYQVRCALRMSRLAAPHPLGVLCRRCVFVVLLACRLRLSSERCRSVRRRQRPRRCHRSLSMLLPC